MLRQNRIVKVRYIVYAVFRKRRFFMERVVDFWQKLGYNRFEKGEKRYAV